MATAVLGDGPSGFEGLELLFEFDPPDVPLLRACLVPKTAHACVSPATDNISFELSELSSVKMFW